MAFTQPAAGTGLVTSSLTSGILVARNNADTTAGTVYGSASGTASRSTPAGNAISYASDANGRYIVNTTAATNGEQWTGVNWGTEFTWICVVKPVAFGGDAQNLIAYNSNPARMRLFLNSSSGPAQVLTYDSGSGGSRSASSASVTDGAINVVGCRYKDVGDVTTVGLNGTRTDAASTGLWDTIGSGDSWQIQGWNAGVQCSKSPIYVWALWNRALSDAEFDSAMSTLAGDCSLIFAVGGGSTFTPRSMLLGVG